MALLYGNFEALFLAALTTFLAGLLMPGPKARLWLLLPAIGMLFLGITALLGMVPGKDYFIAHVVRGFASPVGWFFTGSGVVLAVLSRAAGE